VLLSAEFRLRENERLVLVGVWTVITSKLNMADQNVKALQVGPQGFMDSPKSKTFHLTVYPSPLYKLIRL
jgi:hypothetical protein